MSKIVIDGGGTSLKYAIVDKEYNKKVEGNLDGGNLSTNFDLVLKNIKFLLRKYPEINAGIFAFAGFEGLTDKKKSLIKSILRKINNKIILSDALLPAYISDKKLISLTLGTGTAIFKKENNKVKQYLGFGYAIGDLGSGYEIGKKILFDVLISKDQDLIQEVQGILQTKNDIVSHLWSNKETIQKNIASIVKVINLKNKKIVAIAHSAFVDEFTKFLAFLEGIIDGDDLIILNGGIFSNFPESILAIKNKYKNHEIIHIKHNPIRIGINILKGKKW